jgi:hypothetical protein
MQIAEAVKTVLAQSANGLNVQGVAEATGVLIGRHISSQNISGYLSSIGAEWNEHTGIWTLASTTDVNGEEKCET